MRLDIGDLGSIRAITQRSFAARWFAARPSGRLPSYIGWTTDHREELAELKACRVVFGPPTPRYLIRYHGKIIEQAYGTSFVGQYLDEVVPSHLRKGTLLTYDACVRAHAPIYTVTSLRDATQRPVDWERLLLPFGEDRVTDIVASVNVISPTGDFHLYNLTTANAVESMPSVAKILTDVTLAIGPTVTLPDDQVGG